MIDLGLSKIALIGVVALIVIGPERLPKVARLMGTLLGRAQRYISQVKSEVGREFELDEMRRLKKEFEDAGQAVQSSVNEEMAGVETDFNTLWNTKPPDDGGLALPTQDQLAYKAKEFRRKKVLRSSAVPQWFKHRSGGKSRVLSGAARVARFRGHKSSHTFY
jgi:sec-independent protein translocase protein TatB